MQEDFENNYKWQMHVINMYTVGNQWRKQHI